MAIDARPTPEVYEPGEDDGGRDWVKILVWAGLVAFLAAIGIYIAMNRPAAPEPAPTPTTATVSSEQAAYDASTKTVTDFLSWSAANPGQPASEQFATAAYITEEQASAKSRADRGIRVEGADKLLWAKGIDYRVDSVTVKACLEVHGKLLDKDGNNVRVDPTGKPIEEGTQTGHTYHMMPGTERGTWVISSLQVTATC